MNYRRKALGRIANFAALPCLAGAVLLAAASLHAEPATKTAACPGDNGGLILSPGFCATIFAENIGHARHLVVAADGVVYANTWSGRYYRGDTPPTDGFLVALKDSKGDGHADIIAHFGPNAAEGATGGTGIALYKSGIYVEAGDRIVRYNLPQEGYEPKGKPDVIVSDLPMTGDHPMHPFIIDAEGNIFVDVASATNACQEQNRALTSAGLKPCTELETRAGIWRYDANKTDQKFSPAERYATGNRNGEGMATDAAGRIFVTQHGRDQLWQNWPKLYQANDSAELPAEEVMQLERGADYGWPECYFDGRQKKLVLAPEYGGDGGKAVGVCAEKRAPAAFFPAHWAPNDLLIVNNDKFPAAYRAGAFIAFHGSWNRAPAPQGGYNVVFQPFADGKATGDFVVFADGFAGGVKEPGRSAFRPTGLAVGPDGALYISDDKHGRIWRVTYTGDLAAKEVAPATQLAATTSETGLPPEGVRSDAGRPELASLPLAPGATKEQVALGERIFHGEASDGTCSGCHGSDARGSSNGSDLTTGNWRWGNGDLEAIAQTITNGVPRPRNFPVAMPPLGGATLSQADVAAAAAYVWALGRSRH
jgi:glucose/arabinose dehydrogenase/mono/diheme cytochrome c family protein